MPGVARGFKKIELNKWLLYIDYNCTPTLFSKEKLLQDIEEHKKNSLLFIQCTKIVYVD